MGGSASGRAGEPVVVVMVVVVIMVIVVAVVDVVVIGQHKAVADLPVGMRAICR
jgi:hypothetical protein